jgi:hypothetical protein
MEASITKTAHAKADAQAEAEATPEQLAEAAREKSERAIDHIAELWVELSRMEAWQLLEQELQAQAQKHRKVLTDQAFEQGLTIEQRDVDYDRGLWDGLHRATQVIATARKRLEKKDAKSEPETTEDGGRYW